MKHYILDGEDVVEVGASEWATWFEDASDRRMIKQSREGETRISTVFIGLGEDEIFETMVFGGILDKYQRRCDTLQEAIAQHEAVEKYVIGER